MEKAKFYTKAYIRTITPPYKSHEIPPLIATLFLLFTLLLGTYKGTTIILRSFATEKDITPPSSPNVILGNEKPLILPRTHAEQKSVHLFWTASTDNTGVRGYRIYRNGTKIADTQTTSYDDYGISGRLSYTIEAYDETGNSTKTDAGVYLPENWKAQVSSIDAVIAGFALNKQDNSPLKNVQLTFTTSDNLTRSALTSSSGYYYLALPAKDGEVNISVRAKGYAENKQQVVLKKGLSVHQMLYMTP